MAESMAELRFQCTGVSERGIISSVIDTIEALSTDAHNLATAGAPGMDFILDQLEAVDLDVRIWGGMFLYCLDLLEVQFNRFHGELDRIRREWFAGRKRHRPESRRDQHEVQATRRELADDRGGIRHEGDQSESSQHGNRNSQQSQSYQESPHPDGSQMKSRHQMSAITGEPSVGSVQRGRSHQANSHPDKAQMKPDNQMAAIAEEPDDSIWETPTAPRSPKRKLRQLFRQSWAHFTSKQSRA